MSSRGPGRPRRLHPVSLLFSVGSAARRLLVPGLLLLGAAWLSGPRQGGSRPEVWVMVFFLPALVFAVIHYLTFRYRLQESDLVVTWGLVHRRERNIPYARIQNIDTVENPFHRLLRVAEVRVETASGSEPEATIKVLSRRAIEEIRDRVAQGATQRWPTTDLETTPAEIAPPEPEERILVQLSMGELVRLGLISNRGLYVLLVLWGLAWQLDLLDQERLVQLVTRGLGELQAYTPLAHLIPLWTRVLLVGLSLLLLVLVLRLGTVVWMVLRFRGFTLTTHRDNLRSTYGLYTRHASTLPRHRIQRLELVETFLARLAGRVALRVETAGGKAEERARSGKGWLAPVYPRALVPSLLGEVLPELSYPPGDWQPVARRATRRIAFRRLVLLGLLALACGSLWHWYALLLLPVLAPPVILLAHLQARRLGYHLGERALLLRRGWLVRRITGVPLPRVQSVVLSESPFDRRHGHAHVRIDTAGTALPVRIPYLPADRARQLLERLSREAAGSVFRW